MPREQAAARGDHRGRRRSRPSVGDDHRAAGAEAGEALPLLDGRLGDRAHDWPVVRLLTDPPLELPLVPLVELPLDPVVEDVLPLFWELVEPEVPEVLLVGLEATVVAGDDLLPDDFLASAGSCPETSTSVISSQAATNSASEPAMIRRRMVRTRAIRALLSACPRARAASGLVSVVSCTSWSV